MITFNEIQNIDIENSNIFARGVWARMIAYNSIYEVNINVVNTLFDVVNVNKLNATSQNVYLNMDNVALEFSNIEIPYTGYEAIDGVTSADVLFGFQIPYSLDTYGVSADNLNYLLSGWDVSPLVGNMSYGTSGEEWYDGNRDGIGALYFKNDYGISANGSPVTTITEYAPFDLTLQLSANDVALNNNTISYVFDDGNITNTNELSVTNQYTIANVYNPHVNLTLKNGWVDLYIPLIVNVVAISLSATTYNIYDALTSAVITSAYTFQDIYVSANVLVPISAYDINFDDEESGKQISTNVYYNYEYLTSGTKNTSLTVYDNTNEYTLSSTPTHEGSIVSGDGGALLGGSNWVVVVGDYAYVASWLSNALEIIDVSIPASPTHVGSIVSGDGGALLGLPINLFIKDDYAYVASVNSNAIEIIDISTPSSPTHVGNIVSGDGGALLGAPYSIFVKDDYAYVASLNSNALEIIDISTPSAPSHVGSISNGDGGALLNGPYSVFVKDDYAYVVSLNSNALEIIDISTPSAPSHVGSISNGDGGALLGGTRSVFVKDNYAYVASYNSDSLEIIDISTPASPSHVGSIIDGDGGALLNGAQSVFIKDNYAYVASFQLNALEIIDISTPASPSHVGSIIDGDGGALLDQPYSVFVKDNYAYVASYNSNSLEIVDISNKPFRVFPYPPTTYYVNINESYTDVSNIGTSADPFNYDEFISYINLDGYASASDVFKVQGYRIIEKPTSADTPWTPIQTDPIKKLTIDAWDNVEYGPWMIAVTDYDIVNNAILDFSNCILKNGIIYNKPYTINNSNIGGTIYVTHCFNMYIVNQGDGSLFYIYPDNLNLSTIRGSTIYFSNGISDDDSVYSLTIEDSVLTGFVNNNSFTNALLYLYNDTFNQTSATLNSDFTISATSGCQYEWTAPTNYPFVKDNDGYNETLNWLLNNKKILVPFSGIIAPPNPGKNYRTYENYETGEFGVSRKDYKRS